MLAVVVPLTVPVLTGGVVTTEIGIVIVLAGWNESWIVTEVVPTALPVTISVFPEITAPAIFGSGGLVTMKGVVPPDMVTFAELPTITETFCGEMDKAL